MKIAVTSGDPSGIGPELILKSLPKFLKFKPLIYGNKVVFKKTSQMLKLEKNYEQVKDFIIDSIPKVDFQFGKPNEKTGKFALLSIQAALNDNPDILITAPIVKWVIKRFKKDFIGHTEFLANFYQVKDFAMVGLLKDKRICF